MDVSVTVATLLGLPALFNFLNERFLRLQQTIGFMMIALDGWEAGVDAGVTVVDIGAIQCNGGDLPCIAGGVGGGRRLIWDR